MRRLFLWLALCATAGATPFQANLQNLLGQPASRAWAVLNLQGCGTYIVKGSGSTIIPRPILLYPNAQGLIGIAPSPLVNITDETTYVCGGAVGTAYYRIDIYYTDTDGKTQHPAGDNYDIAGLSPFNLNTAVPKNNFVGGIGPQGPPGPTGPAGPTGPTGAAGANGANGTNGAPGAQGPQGPEGPAGIAGGQVLWRGTYNAGNTYSKLDAVTFQGSSYLSTQDSNIGHSPDTAPSFWGLMAQAGVNGATGATGPQGPAGSQGPQGPAGGTVAWRGTWSSATAYVLNDAVAFNGSSYVALQSGTNKQPDTNPTYWQLAAQKGDAGPTGATGAIGATGPTGATGSAGAAATATAGSTTTGAPGTNAAVVNSGSTSAAVFDFTIPRGAVGATGPQGPQGPPGTATAAGAPADVQIAGATGSLDADTGKFVYTKAVGAVPGILSVGAHAMTGHPELSLSYTLSGAQLPVMQLVISGPNGAQTVVGTLAAAINPLRWNVNDTFQLNNLPSANALNTLNGVDFKATAVGQTRPTGTVTFSATTSIVPGTYVLNQGYAQIYGDTMQGHVLLFNRCQSTTNNPAQTGTCGLAFRDAFKWRAGPSDYMGHDVAGMRGGTKSDPINSPGTGALRVNGAHSPGATSLSIKKDAGSNWVAVNGDKIAILHGNADKDFDVYTITNSPNVTVTQGANTSVTISPALLTSLLDGEFISPYILKIQVGDASGLEVPGPADFAEVPNFIKGIPEAQITSLPADLAARPLNTLVLHNSGDETATGVKTFSSGIISNVTGVATSATVATALAADPSNCTAGNAPAGIAANGDAQGCGPIVASPAGVFKDIQYAGNDGALHAAAAGIFQFDETSTCLKIGNMNICGAANQENKSVYTINAIALTAPGSGKSQFGFTATTGLFELRENNGSPWFPAHDASVVHITGDESAAGKKTFSDQVIVSGLGIEFVETDSNPTCAAGNFNIFADLSENKLKKCMNGVATDLDTTAAGVGYSTLAEEGSSLTQRSTFNFIGAALTAVDNSGSARTDITLSQSPASASVVGTGRTLTAGAGLSGGGDLTADRTVATDSTEADFLASGALTCGAATQGKIKVHTTPLQYCDNAATPLLRYAADGDSTGKATTGDSATAFFAAGQIEAARGGTGADSSGWTGLAYITAGAWAQIAPVDVTPKLYAAGGGTAQAQTLTLSPAATALTTGLTVRWKPNAANSGAAPTLAVNGLTATAITKCGASALVANDLTTTAVAIATYDGTQFQLLNPQAVSCGAAGSVVADSVALTTSTTGNYVQSITTTAPVTGGAAGSEGANLTIAVSAATTTNTGVAEAAINTEVDAGTDAARYVSPNALKGSTIFGVKTVEVELFPPGTATATGDGKAYFRIPASLNGMNLISVKATVYTAGTTGTTNVDIDRCAAAATGNVCSGTVNDMLSTNMTIDSGENDTATAATAAVIDVASDDVATGQILRFNVDAINTTPAQGLLVELSFQLP